jgi:hypothetical protein
MNSVLSRTTCLFSKLLPQLDAEFIRFVIRSQTILLSCSACCGREALKSLGAFPEMIAGCVAGCCSIALQGWRCKRHLATPGCRLIQESHGHRKRTDTDYGSPMSFICGDLKLQETGQFALRTSLPALQIFPLLWPKTVLKVAGTLDGTCRCAMASIWS